MLSMKQQKFMLELLINKSMRPNENRKKGIFCNDGDFFHQVKALINNGFIKRDDGEYSLTFKGLLLAKILALNEPRYNSCLKKEIIEFQLDPNGY